MNAPRPSFRTGFTLVETMVAAAITTIVSAAVFSTFLSAHRLMRTAMAEAELSLGARAVRDRLLFRLPEEVVGQPWTGLLGDTAFTDRALWDLSAEDFGFGDGARLHPAFEVDCLARSPATRTRVYRTFVDVELRADVSNPDGTPISRTERVQAPRFGYVQPFVDAEGGL